MIPIRTPSPDATPAAWNNALTGQDLLVRALIATDRLPEATALARALTELYPRSARARVLYGYSLAVSGDARAASEQYARASEVSERESPEARTATAQGLTVPPADWYWLDLLARNALEGNRVREAVSLAGTITALYPRIGSAYVTYGRALATSGDRQGADQQFAKALEVNPLETRALEWRRRVGVPPDRAPPAGVGRSHRPGGVGHRASGIGHRASGPCPRLSSRARRGIWIARPAEIPRVRSG